MQLDEKAKLWLLVGSKSTAIKSKMLKVMLTDIVLPALEAERTAYIGREKGVALAAGHSAASVENQVALLEEVNTCLTFDGESMFLQRLVEVRGTLVDDYPFVKRVVMMKHPASCSMAQQPLDVSKCFKSTKLELQKQLECNPHGHRQHYTPVVETMLAAIPTSSRAVFIRWTSLLPVVLSHAFSVGNVLEGWRIAGLCPVDHRQIMRMCTAWEDIAEPASHACLRAIKELAPLMLKNGQLTDDEIQAAVGPALVLSKRNVHDKSGKKVRLALDEMALNRRRALIISHHKILADPKAAPRAAKGASKAAKVNIFLNLNCLTIFTEQGRTRGSGGQHPQTVQEGRAQGQCCSGPHQGPPSPRCQGLCPREDGGQQR